MLFSEEAVSLRHVEGFINKFQSNATPGSKVSALSALLLEKLPYIGQEAANKFTQAVISIHSRFEAAKASKQPFSFKDIPEGEASPFTLLVRTALADTYVSKVTHSTSRPQ
jgi:hypothetical protein